MDNLFGRGGRGGLGGLDVRSRSDASFKANPTLRSASSNTKRGTRSSSGWICPGVDPESVRPSLQ